MSKPDKMPLWIYFAFSNIGSRKVALYIVYASAIFTLYCFPWPRYFTVADSFKSFLIEDWTWFAMMLPITIWYWVSLRWIDQNFGWDAVD